MVQKSRRSPVEVGSLFRYLRGFIHPQWCRISSINSIITSQDLKKTIVRQTFQPDSCWVVEILSVQTLNVPLKLTLDIQIPSEKVFGVCFWGPNTFSGGIWMFRVTFFAP